MAAGRRSAVRVDEQGFEATDDLVEDLVRNGLDSPYPSSLPVHG